MNLTPHELEFLRGQRLGRLATVAPSGWPHVMPVMYELSEAPLYLEFDADGIKLRNLSAEPRAAIVVDAMNPRRGMSFQGRCSLVGEERARLIPERRFSWGLPG